MNVQQMKS